MFFNKSRSIVAVGACLLAVMSSSPSHAYQSEELPREWVESCPDFESALEEISFGSAGEAFVWRALMAFSRETPYSDTVETWSAAVESWDDVPMMAQFVSGTDVFTQLNNASRDDRHFVENAYWFVMCREGDTAGVEYWNRQLQSGLSRTHLIMWFADSLEYQRLTGVSQSLFVHP